MKFDVVTSNPPFRVGTVEWEGLTSKHQEILADGGSYALVCPVDNIASKDIQFHCEQFGTGIHFKELIYVDTEVYYYIWKK